MIDIFNEVFTRIAGQVRSEIDGISVSGEYVATPKSFPALAVDEIDNTIVESDSSGRERYNRIRYRTQVFSNKQGGKHAEARKIQSVVDKAFYELGFRRTSYSPTPDVIDNTVYCITAVYSAVIGEDGFIRSSTR